MENNRKGLPTQTISDCALVMTVLKVYWSQIDLVGFRVEPSSSVTSSVLMKIALNSRPINYIQISKLIWLIFCVL